MTVYLSFITLLFQSRLEEGDDPYLVKMEDPILRKAFSSSSSTASGGAFRLKQDIPPQYHNVFNLDHPVVEGGGNDNVGISKCF